MKLTDFLFWVGAGAFIGLVFGAYLGDNTAVIVKQCNDRMYFIADDGMYLCKRHDPFK